MLLQLFDSKFPRQDRKTIVNYCTRGTGQISMYFTITYGISVNSVTVVGPKSKPRLLPKSKLEEGKSLSKEERREAEQEKLANIPEKAQQNYLVQKMAARAYQIEN
jgi:hypothetical protein